MAKQFVSLAIPLNNGCVQTVTGDAYGDWLVHLSVPPVYKDTKWTVTHIPTRRALGFVSSKAKAIRIAREVKALPFKIQWEARGKKILILNTDDEKAELHNIIKKYTATH